LLLCCDAAVAEDWTAYTSENFTIYSDEREQDVIPMLERFELFRSLVLDVLDVPRIPENEKLRILMFAKRSEFIRASGMTGAQGVFYHDIYGPRMIVSAEIRSADVQATLFHEYVHYLANRHSSVNYPRWYSEGLAELISSVEFRERSVVLGAPSELIRIGGPLDTGRGTSFRPTPVRQMIDLDSRDSPYAFYATAWLMVHYFLVDALGEEPQRIPQTQDYLLRVDAGEDPVMAFEASYGNSPEDLDSRLQAHFESSDFKALSFPRNDYSGSVSRTVLETDEAWHMLGDFAAEIGQNKGAYHYLDEVDTSSPSPLSLLAMATRAVAYGHDQRFAESDALIEEILESDPSDTIVLGDIAHVYFDRYLAIRDSDTDLAPQVLRRSLEFGAEALLQDPGNLEAIYYLGLSLEASGEYALAAQTLLGGYAISPTVRNLNLALARMALRLGETDVALNFISRVYSASHSDEYRTRLAEARSRIQDIDFVLEVLGALE
jgi:tetratricopeptide (TPR) repeat protein